MAPHTLDFQCALITGGGGGLGRAMAEYFISQGKKVIIAGRTLEKLEKAAKEIKCESYYQLDTGDIKSIKPFIKKITSEHPELDCIINNAGVQRPLDFKKMSADDFLEKADNEIDIDIRGPMHLSVGLLPHFRSKKAAVIMNVSSVLGYIPFSIINPVYNGAKAFLHFHTMNMRTQLAAAGDDNIKVVEIAPPGVGTDLHREREDPDDNKEGKNGAISVEQFMEEVIQQWKDNKDYISAGPGIKIVGRWYDEFGPDYNAAADKVLGKK